MPCVSYLIGGEVHKKRKIHSLKKHSVEFGDQLNGLRSGPVEWVGYQMTGLGPVEWVGEQLNGLQ